MEFRIDDYDISLIRSIIFVCSVNIIIEIVK
jgi:hypothetical protein